MKKVFKNFLSFPTFSIALSMFFMISCSEEEDVQVAPEIDETTSKMNDSHMKHRATKIYVAELHELNNSGVEGKATFIITGGHKVFAKVFARNLAPNMVHPQHIHAKSECPPPSAAGDDGLLTIADGLPFYGPVLVPLDSELVPLPAGSFPVANRVGFIYYLEKVELNELVEALMIDSADELDMAERTVVLHGAYVKDNMIVAPGTPGAEYVPTLPVACGEIKMKNSNMMHPSM